MARLYADEDFSYPVIQRLRQFGHDVLTAHEAGQVGQGIPDTEVLVLRFRNNTGVFGTISHAKTIGSPSPNWRGNCGAQHLALATMAGRAVLTFNRRHFIRPHSEGLPHAGIIVCTRDDDVVALADRIHQQLQNVPTLQEQVLRINRPSRA
jgi:hypothetical protein